MHHPLLTLTQTATPEAAIALQQELRSLVVMEDDLDAVKTVAGVDVGFEEDDRTACAAIAVLRFPDLALQESVMIRRPTTFPYVPGLLAFREVPLSELEVRTMKRSNFDNNNLDNDLEDLNDLQFFCF
ncbi:endonuclease V [Leptolyngbya sp. FACHB-16]|uniref:endonuclease V n=1 Tax=unclassified Leptolyngbya TaxID=2650499 RepID=UPI0016883212|nr:endonuclease V [Leptolyngbya sp. FACHB-16]MBD2156052.1 endonuclease V [Leptolyngbya sp. FACHB-16]